MFCQVFNLIQETLKLDINEECTSIIAVSEQVALVTTHTGKVVVVHVDLIGQTILTTDQLLALLELATLPVGVQDLAVQVGTLVKVPVIEQIVLLLPEYPVLHVTATRILVWKIVFFENVTGPSLFKGVAGAKIQNVAIRNLTLVMGMPNDNRTC